MSKKNIWMVGIFGVVAGAIVLFVVLRKKKGTPDPGDVPEPEEPVVVEPIVSDPPVSDPVLNPLPPVTYPKIPKPDPEPPIKPSPMKPESFAKKGSYYAVKKGDTMFGVLGEAGYAKGATRQKAYISMLNHDRNAWVGQTNANDGSRILRFLRHFAANPGYENETWAWATEYKPAASSSWKWPVVWIPDEGEVSA
jgi:hypothetical protein